MREVLVEHVSKDAWDSLLEGFEDATLYQSWAYGAVHWGTNGLSHMVVREAGSPIGLAQVRLVAFPLKLGGIAYVTRGPLWRPVGQPDDPARFDLVVRAVLDEYCVKRGCYLRIVPQIFGGDDHASVGCLSRAGFRLAGRPYRTILVDLRPSLDELRAGMRTKWRQVLNKAEKRGYEVVEGTDDSLFEEVYRLYQEMHQRKQYAEFVNPAAFRAMQSLLPSGRRLRLLVCRQDGESVAGVAWAAFGETGFPVFGGAGNRALGQDASYVMHWQFLQSMKREGLRYCDLGGINPERNPGSYLFKTGLAKKTGVDITLIGEFDACRNPVSRLAFVAATKPRQRWRTLQLRLEERRRHRQQDERSAASAEPGDESDAQDKTQPAEHVPPKSAAQPGAGGRQSHETEQ